MSDNRGVAVIFPVAANIGGVELIAREALEYFAPRRSTSFVGSTMHPHVPGVRHVQVATRSGHVRRPVAFRRESERAVRSVAAEDVRISLGANCAPGDVRYVQSVHAAYLRMPGHLQAGPLRISASWRRALPRHRALLTLERNYFERHPPSLVLATAERERADLIELYGVDERAIHVVGNGYNPNRFSVEHRTRVREDVRARLGIRHEQLSILFPANELHRKGFSTLLMALQRLRLTDVRVDVVGRADPGPLVASARSRGWTPDVYWHGSSSSIEDFYAAADLMVLPTYYEPFGLVIIEALATGLPVVTTRVAGASPYVTPACGRLQERADDVEELCELLKSSLERTTLQQMSSAAPAAVKELEWSLLFRRIEGLVFGS